ncbi:hypothetical protein BU26DRAFT_120949 [Trematosphaeria pertusa]|uniref:SRR1-like domain-containing protein n=1 Tax=Trematosphaeria pertusa TaxID=390896 RepID=A0A6A6HXG4_9PLEO|nr:uncharacterized protein BU26DRAFT_120949 [Trematosphaeria pertusa]KAF2242904.1 hypothetical protein BU26DRAFT_120949 [Trematosphaeria pertusa]
MLRLQCRCLFYFDVRFYTGDILRCSLKAITPSIEESIKAWNDSEVQGHLENWFQQSGKRSPEVTKIVCFGAGNIVSQQSPKAKPKLRQRALMQHLAACTIATALGKAQASNHQNPNKIKIYAQDPEYTLTCDEVLAHLDPPIEVVDLTTVDGMKLIDRNTFVLTDYSCSPIVEAAIDLAPPAGILGPEMTVNPESVWVRDRPAEENWSGDATLGGLLIESSSTAEPATY